MPIFRRKNYIHTASGIVALCKRLHSTPVESRLQSVADVTPCRYVATLRRNIYTKLHGVTNRDMNTMVVRFYDNLVGVVTCCGLDGSGSISGVGDVFHTVQTDPETHTTFCTMANGSFPELKRNERGADHLLLAWVRIGWSYTSSYPLCLHRHVMG